MTSDSRKTFTFKQPGKSARRELDLVPINIAPTKDGECWPAWNWPGCSNYFGDPFEHLTQNIPIFSDPEQAARHQTVRALSKNLLKKYGLGKQKGAEDKGSGGSGGGAKPKEKPAGRKTMTAEKKEMIKGESIISLGHQGAL